MVFMALMWVLTRGSKDQIFRSRPAHDNLGSVELVPLELCGKRVG